MTAYERRRKQALSLAPRADSLSTVESIDLCIHVEDREIRSVQSTGNCEAEDDAGQNSR